MLFTSRYRDYRDLHSFPTRRSSDLNTAFGKYYGFSKILEEENMPKSFSENIPYFDYNEMETEWWGKIHEGLEDISWPGKPTYFRSEEHTSELQSREISYAVFCLKKK